MDDAEIRAREDRTLRGAAIGFAVTAVLAAGITWAAIETRAAILGLLAFIVLGVGLGIFANARMRIAFARFERLRAARRAAEQAAKTG
jgi:hypothetical protein